MVIIIQYEDESIGDPMQIIEEIARYILGGRQVGGLEQSLGPKVVSGNSGWMAART